MKYSEVHREIRAGEADQLERRVLRALEAVAAGGHQVAAVAHPLGFGCIPLHRSRTHGICLHLWPAQLAPAVLTTSDVHCHSWDLVSYVLYGRLRNDVLCVTEADPPTHRVFEVHSRGGLDELRATSRLVRCRPQATEFTEAGGSYSLPAGAFHRTVPPGGEAGTLVLARYRPHTRDLSVGDIDTPDHRVRRKQCSAAETRLLAEAGQRSIRRGVGP